MTSREENELLTHVGPGTPMGELLRRYWQPAALAEELLVGSPPLPVRLLGEDLVLFRDDAGRPGLLGLHCAHRGADLSYGRLEDGGLRCIYHGWLYNVEGRCLEQPGEPSGSTFHERIRQTAYPCREVGGLILAYMGPAEPPLVPAYEFLEAPEGQRFATKLHQVCNFLQGNEGNLDQAHVSFLHRRLEAGPDGESALTAQDTSPMLDPVETDFGVRIYSVRRAGPGEQFVKISNFVMPNFAAVPGGGLGDGYTVNWHVPIDDTHHWKYVLIYRRSRDLEPESIRRNRSDLTADYHLIRNKGNRYLQDREEMKTRTFAGVGLGFQAQDTCATEGRPIQDRTEEHLAYTDRPIMASRKVLLEAIHAVQEGRDPRHVVRDPSANEPPDIVVRADIIPDDAPYKDHWLTGVKRREIARSGV